MKKVFYGSLAALAIIYLFIILFLQQDSTTLLRYRINETQLRLLSLTIVLPLIAIWFAAVFSVVNVGKYYEKIKKSADGKAFKYLLLGLLVLAYSLPITSILSRVLLFAVQNDAMDRATATIINTHLSVVCSLVGFYLVLLGAQALVRTLKKVQVSQKQIIWVAMGLVTLSVFYTYATLLNPSREVAIAPTKAATYAMPDGLIITTIVIPYVWLWAFGFYATLLFNAYHHNVGGKLYRQSLKKLKYGFFIVILTSILLQFFTAASATVAGWGLSVTLIAVYVLLFVIAAGYVYIALGAKGLAKLEDVT